MSESLEQKIVELNRELTTLKEDHNKLSLEAKKLAERRDSIHKRIKNLRVEVLDLKEKRDTLNERVQELKSLRDRARAEIRDKNNQIYKLKEKVGRTLEKRELNGIHKIQKDINSLEWKIQTTHLTLTEEKSLVERVRLLEAQLLIHTQIQKLKSDLVESQAESNTLKVKAETYHEKLLTLAEQSQTHHEKMIESLNKIHDFQAEADHLHQIYVQTRNETRFYRQKQGEISHKIKNLKQKLHRAEEERQTRRRLEIHKALKDKALKKFRRGEKLTLDEFKILAEQGDL